ncbi:MAG: hypothetical protein WBN01_16505 [Polyangiales bacterium]
MLTNVCIAVYIAANRPLPTIDWDESQPAFYVATLGKDEEPVRNQFTKPHVYYAGSHEGCSCGFQLGNDRSPEDPEQARGRESLGAFAKYLEDALTRVDDVELFACWEGEQEAGVGHRRHLTPTDLRRDDFCFLERELSVLRL